MGPVILPVVSKKSHFGRNMAYTDDVMKQRPHAKTLEAWVKRNFRSKMALRDLARFPESVIDPKKAQTLAYVYDGDMFDVLKERPDFHFGAQPNEHHAEYVQRYARKALSIVATTILLDSGNVAVLMQQRDGRKGS